MPDSKYLVESVVFRPRLERDQMPCRCTICGSNPSVFEYRKPPDAGSCCTACAFNILVKLANDEISHWTGLFGVDLPRRVESGEPGESTRRR
jgi:hypothetical protein